MFARSVRRAPAVAATWLSSTALRCDSPPASDAGVVELVLSGRGVSATAAAEFEYYAPPRIERTTPTHGPAVGGTLVLVSGTGFVVDAPAAMCRFARSSRAGRELARRDVVLCQAPSHKAGEVTVEVTMNNVDFTSDGVRFTYGAAVAVHAVSPYSGSGERRHRRARARRAPRLRRARVPVRGTRA